MASMLEKLAYQLEQYARALAHRLELINHHQQSSAVKNELLERTDKKKKSRQG